MSEIGNRIKNKRKERDMTLEEVGKRAGMARQTLSRYETGVITKIPLDKIEVIAYALRTTPAYLMGWEDDPDKPRTDNSAEQEIQRLLEHFAAHPEGMNLLKSLKDAAPEEILQAVRIIEAIKKPAD